MKVTHRAGHNPACEGASHFVNEVVEDRKIHESVVKHLKAGGAETIDCTPPNMADSASELMFGIKKANETKADLFFSIHLNASTPRQEAVGSEVWVYPNDNFTKDVGGRICDNLGRLGFKNRGVKESKGLAELNYINYSSMIIEVFFLDSREDVDLYKRVGVDVIGKAIAEGILGKSINSPVEAKKPVEGDLRGRQARCIAKDGLFVREKPSTDSKKLGMLKNGQGFRPHKVHNNEWISIYYNPHGGYVHRDYIEFLD